MDRVGMLVLPGDMLGSVGGRHGLSVGSGVYSVGTDLRASLAGVVRVENVMVDRTTVDRIYSL